MGVQIIYIDHAGMINVNDDTPQWEKSSKISKTIKNVQKELSVPIVLLSQVGRQAENKAPTLADLRGSGSFEEDADTVMFLHRERLESVNDEPIPAELNIAKCRDGEIGLVELLFFPKLTRFMDKAEKRFEK
jgi:replicative DNA helicase